MRQGWDGQGEDYKVGVLLTELGMGMGWVGHPLDAALKASEVARERGQSDWDLMESLGFLARLSLLEDNRRDERETV